MNNTNTTTTAARIAGLSVRQVTSDPYVYVASFKGRCVCNGDDRAAVRVQAEKIIRARGLKIVDAGRYDWAWPEWG